MLGPAASSTAKCACPISPSSLNEAAMSRMQVTGLNLESGKEGGGVCGLWRQQWDACDLSGARLGWGVL